jgi:hypothetical protein
LIVTKHQSQQQGQTKSPPSYDDEQRSNGAHQSNDRDRDHGIDNNGNDFLSDSTIESLRQQVRMQRAKVDDER